MPVAVAKWYITITVATVSLERLRLIVNCYKLHFSCKKYNEITLRQSVSYAFKTNIKHKPFR